ncbi:glycosyltransferase [Leuconostoc falkenbergense]|uniref:Glycosyltransferase n=1 Tax=Leuconostoc falkenbergense TaxID=2766470 RepID=A0A9X3IPR6_9LACO|nr:glycosyltransferase [Leuconostoc falkenbergense]MCX7579383.1 glycosyltransferase [Leuconostoc falkenbergense]
MASTASFIAQFNHRNIKILQSMGYEVHVAANFTHYGTLSAKSNQQFMDWLASKKVVIHNIPVERGLGKFRQNVAVLFLLNRLMKENQFKIIHVHTPIASVLGRLAALKNHVPVVYTAHGFHFSKTSAWINWLIFPIEWLFSFCTSELLLINQEDFFYQKSSVSTHLASFYDAAIGHQALLK